MDGDIFENAPRVEGIFFIRIKKMHFRNYPDTCGRGLRIKNKEYAGDGLDGEKFHV